MPYVLQSWTTDGRPQFNSSQPPLVFLGKVFAPANMGNSYVSSARAQYFDAPTMSPPVETCQLTVPAGTSVVAVLGAKVPARIGLAWRSNTLYFTGYRDQSCTFYCFGAAALQPAPPGSGMVCETYNTDGTVAWNTTTQFMRPATSTISANGLERISVPAGRTWAAVLVGNTVSSQFRVFPGGRRYEYINNSGPYADASVCAVRGMQIDIVVAPPVSGEDDVGVIYRTAGLYAVDVTGL